MNINLSTCREHILSEDYLDVQLEQAAYLNIILKDYPDSCIQSINEQYSIAYIKRQQSLANSNVAYNYSSIPNLYGLMDNSALESSGILKVSTNPLLNLKGQGVLIGFVDTGIDYRHPVFLDDNGKTRITAIWDQTVQNGEPPEGFLYGTEYTSEEINWAISAKNPTDIVPSIDEIGHGTYLAGVAAGSQIPDKDFMGAAPQAAIAMVKLKPAKKFFREYYHIKEEAIAYQENDILTGVNYLVRLQTKLDLPLVICIGLGTNMGGHMGCCFLESYLEILGKAYRTAVVCAAGNEANQFHHYRGQIQKVGDYEDVEISVGEQEQKNGFIAELWSDIPQIYAVGFVSPTGEVIERTTISENQRIKLWFLLDDTRIEISYHLVNDSGGSQVIQIRFTTPNSGVWKIRVYNMYQIGGIYDIWLPISDFISQDTIFLKPSAEVTITDPANSKAVITVGAYNHKTNSIYINSGRGNSRRNAIKPTLVAPGVQIQGPKNNTTSYITSTGTSSACALTAGATACLFTWAITKGNMTSITGTLVQFYLIAGVRTNPALTYPNKEWGYGSLDLYHVFEVLRSIQLVN